MSSLSCPETTETLFPLASSPAIRPMTEAAKGNTFEGSGRRGGKFKRAPCHHDCHDCHRPSVDHRCIIHHPSQRWVVSQKCESWNRFITDSLSQKMILISNSISQTKVGDEPQYCNKNATTLKATNFNYQPRDRTNIRGISTVCATYNVSFLCCHDVMERM